MNHREKVFVAGHTGLVGSAVVRRLAAAGHERILVSSRAILDLRDQAAVDRFFRAERPDVVILAAAKVGGILANDTYPADFIADNLAIGLSVVTASFHHGTRLLLNLGSSCIYPRNAPQPLMEDYLLSGPLESTNESYAVAKIAILKLCQAFNRQHDTRYFTVMPTNLYGPFDNFDPLTGHVLPALIRRFHDAKALRIPEVSVWGTGEARREFLHVDDLADACVRLIEAPPEYDMINVGCGFDIRIADLARLIARIVGYEGKIVFDTSRPEGTPRKLLDITRITASGWCPTVPLEEGIARTYRWYVLNSSRGAAEGHGTL